MSRHPDIHVVEERMVLPVYAANDGLHRGLSPAILQGCLRWLLNIFFRPKDTGDSQIAGGIVTVQLPPPPSVHGFMTFFRHDLEVIQRSRRALDKYRSQYQDSRSFPLRIREARHTGLPAFLNGLLDEQESPEIANGTTEIMARWLFQDLRAEALFGTDSSQAQQQLAYVAAIKFNHGQPDQEYLVRQTRDGIRATVHGYYQQKYQEWPIFGGQVVVHLATENQRTVDRRMSVTSSYFPVPATSSFSAQVSPEQAISLAQQALAGYLEGPEAIGLYWRVLRPWLEALEEGETSAEPWQPAHTHIARKQLRALAALGELYDISPKVKELVEAGLGRSQDELVAALRPIWESRPQIGLPEWRVEVVPYMDSKSFILPFAGRYHLAYLVELLSTSGDNAWRVFVDAENGVVLGRPESLVTYAPAYYPTASDALNHSPVDLDMPLSALANAVGAFMELNYYGDGPVNLGTINVDDFDITSSDEDKRVNGEAVNIAVHANQIFDHLVTVCGATGLHSPTGPALQAVVGKGGTSLDMGFVFATIQDPKPIIFQTDGGAGLAISDEPSKRVHGPSLDPEIIYHEIVHGLMWLMKRGATDQQIFDQQIESVPFARALIEGYANYFAHSLADRFEPGPPSETDLNLWAQAAYRKDSGPTPGDQGWEARWALSRTSLVAGEDRLPAPNLYPHNETTGLPVYDVGMIFARALWDMRNLLGADLADQLALRAFGYVLGWVANFEMMAEGVIHQAQLDPAVSDAQVEAIIDIFSQRGILAERGVQALDQVDDGQGGTILLVGTDAGVKRSLNNGQVWDDWGQLSGGGLLKGVVTLATEGSTVYAATEKGVYQRGNHDGTWSSVGAWPTEYMPLCMLVFSGVPYVGTARGVLCFEKDGDQGGSWKRWEPAGPAFEAVAVDMALQKPGIRSYVYVATMFDPQRRSALGSISPTWGTTWNSAGHIGGSSDEGLSIAVVIADGIAYMGTLADGVWQQPLSNTSTTWSRIATKGDLGEGAVLMLRAHGQDLFAATTSGLFQGTRVGGQWTWQQIQIGNPPAVPVDIVTDVLPLDGLLLVGTATQGLWVREGTTWTQHPDIGA